MQGWGAEQMRHVTTIRLEYHLNSFLALPSKSILERDYKINTYARYILT